jgi:photosystem II stability/assembly factor-like uncharacterized protein
VADVGADGTENTDDDIVGQPSIAYAAPYEIVINTDVDPNVDAIHDGKTGDSVPTGYAPVTFHTGAETIRYTLDSTGDGTIDSNDWGDDADEAVVQNQGLALLHRETYGYNGTDNVNDDAPVGLIRKGAQYPNGSWPAPLFQYWGDFDSDAALDLWGDDGTGGGTAGNGILEAGEVAALGAVTAEDTDGDGTLDSGEDRNGNGTLEKRVTDLIKKVEVHVTTETSYADVKHADPHRSSSTEAFPYRVVSKNFEVEPRNVDLPGGACGDEPERTTGIAVANACTGTLADGKAALTWSASPDDGNFEMDIEKYLVWRTSVHLIFGSTPHDEVAAGTTAWDDDWIDLQAWPPEQYWYRVRAMDCTPRLSRLDPVAGPYPPQQGPKYPEGFRVIDPAGDDGTNLTVYWQASLDDPSNTTGYGSDVNAYHVIRSTSSNYRCQAAVNNSAIAATGAGNYSFTDNGTNSSSALSEGELYYYWLRAVDDAGAASPYTYRQCGRPSVGPTFPRQPRARIASYDASTDHPVEVWFSQNSLNEAAGYDPHLVEYNIYRSPDRDGDGTFDSLVDDTVGYRDAELQATVTWQGLVWTVGMGSSTNLYHSIDGGASWRDLDNPATLPSDLHAIDFATRLSGLAVGPGGRVLRTKDGGVSWTEITSGAMVDLNDVAFVNERVAVAVGNTGELIRSTDGGASWASVGSGLIDDLNAVAATGATVIVTGRNGAAAVSHDEGATFSVASFTGDTLKDACAVTEGGGAVTLVAGGDERLWASTDGGSTWNEYSEAGMAGTAGDFVAVACQPGGVVRAIGESSGDLWYTADAGGSWVVEQTIAGATAVEMLDPDLVWVADQSGNIHQRSSSGSWTSYVVDGMSMLLDLAVRPEIAWEDSGTASDASGTRYFYIVTAAYDQSDPSLDGESGRTPDRPGPPEDPNDGDTQILVDACRNFELSVSQP